MASQPPLLLPKDCYRVAQVCRLLGISRQAVHQQRIRGTISFIIFSGRRYMFPKVYIDALVQKANDEAHHAPPP